MVTVTITYINCSLSVTIITLPGNCTGYWLSNCWRQGGGPWVGDAFFLLSLDYWKVKLIFSSSRLLLLLLSYYFKHLVHYSYQRSKRNTFPSNNSSNNRARLGFYPRNLWSGDACVELTFHFTHLITCRICSICNICNHEKLVRNPLLKFPVYAKVDQKANVNAST